jgi:uncharacterized protein
MSGPIPYIALGLAAGALSGLIGIGGGIVIIPALLFVFGFTQVQAQGTTLALMVPPIGLLAAWTYYKHGSVNIFAAAMICIGFFVGGFLGAKVAVVVPNAILRRIFGVSMITLGIQLVFGKQ